MVAFIPDEHNGRVMEVLQCYSILLDKPAAEFVHAHLMKLVNRAEFYVYGIPAAFGEGRFATEFCLK